MLHRSYRLLRSAYRSLYKPWQNTLLDLGISLDEIVEQKNHRLYIKRLDLTVELPQHAFFLRRLKIAFAIAQTGGKFSVEDGEIHFRHGEYHVVVRQMQNVDMLHEIYCTSIYNFDTMRDCVVCDIGMNIGFVSLYFCQRPGVKAVYGFEPFGPSYETALTNIALNPGVKHKLKPYHYGVAGETKDVQADYFPEFPGSVSVYWQPRGVPKDARSQTVTVHLEPITTILEMITGEIAPSDTLIFKIDCEGAEYDIIAQLHEHGLIERISGFMIEWHYRGPEVLLDTLKQHGYFTLRANQPRSELGMIYAFKN